MSKVILVVLMLTILSGCAIGKDGLTTGLNGCVSVNVEEGELNVPSLFNVKGKGLHYHKINPDCENIPYHGKGVE